MMGKVSPVVISRLEKLNAIIENLVNKPVHFVDSPGPHVATKLLQVLGFSNSGERFTHYRFDQIQSSECQFSICVHPVVQVFAAFIL